MDDIVLCDYGCGNKGLYILNNGKNCCSNHHNTCSELRRKNSIGNKNKKPWNKNKKLSLKTRLRMSDSRKGQKNPMFGKTHSDRVKQEISRLNKGRVGPMKGRNFSKKHRKNIGLSKRLTINQIQKKYPTFYKVEELRYNPEKIDKNEIQVRCKNHKCKNSKEKNGWFTPIYTQLYERIRSLESKNGTGGS